MIQPALPKINKLLTPLLRLLLCVCLSEQLPCTLCLLDCSLLPPVIIAPAKVFMQSKAAAQCALGKRPRVATNATMHKGQDEHNNGLCEILVSSPWRRLHNSARTSLLSSQARFPAQTVCSLFKIYIMSCIHEHSWHSHFQIFTQPCLHWCQEARYTIGCNIFSEGCIWKGVFCWMKLLTQNCAGTTSFKLLQAFLN